MRDLKKLLVVLVVISMMVTSIIVPTFAAAGTSSYSYETQAKGLYDLGLFKGNSTGAYDPDLGSKLTRAMGVTMVERMLGVEEDALAMADSEVAIQLAKFTDGSATPTWAKKQVAYAIKNGMVVGYGNGIYGPNDALIGDQFSSMVLQAAGYADFTYNTATSTLGGGLAGFTSDEVTKFATKQLIRDDFVGMSFKVIKNLKYKGSNDTIVAKLIAKGKVDKDKADQVFNGGSQNEFTTPTTKVMNAREVTVTFNKELNRAAAEYAGNYTFDGISSMNSTTAQYASLSSDNRTVTLTTPADMDNNDDVTLQISHIRSADGTSVYSTSEDLTLDASVLPDAEDDAISKLPQVSVSGVKIVGTNEIQVTFSGPVMAGDPQPSDAGHSAKYLGAYSIGVGSGDPLNLASYDTTITNPSGDLKTFIISMPKYNGLLSVANSLYVNVNIGKDTNGDDKHALIAAAGYDRSTVPQYYSEAPIPNAKNDTDHRTRPVVESASVVSKNTLAIKFSQYMDVDTLKSNDGDIKWSSSEGSGIAEDVADQDIRGLDTLYVTFDNSMPTSGTFKVTVDKERMMDLFGAPADDDCTVDVQAVPNMEITATAKQGDNQKQVVITFSDAMDASTLNDVSNYKIDGKSFDSIVSTTNDNKKVTLETSSDITGGEHTITIQDMEDKDGDDVAKITTNVTIKDETDPTIESITYRNNVQLKGDSSNELSDVILIQYSEKMGEEASDLSNYALVKNDYTTDITKKIETKDNLLSSATIDGIDTDDGTLVRITADADKAGDISATKFYVSRTVDGVLRTPKDLAGNTLSTKDGTVTFDRASNSRGDNYFVTNMTAGSDVSWTSGAADSILSSGNIVDKTHATVKAVSGKGFRDIDKSKFEAAIGGNFGVDSDKLTIKDAKISSSNEDHINDTIAFTFDSTMKNGDDTNISGKTIAIKLKESTDKAGFGNDTVSDLYGARLKVGTMTISTDKSQLAITDAELSQDNIITLTFSTQLATTTPTQGENVVTNKYIYAYATKNGEEGPSRIDIESMKKDDNDPLKYNITLKDGIDTTKDVYIRTVGDPRVFAANATKLEPLPAAGMKVTELQFKAVSLSAPKTADGAILDSGSDGVNITFSKSINSNSINDIDEDWTQAENDVTGTKSLAFTAKVTRDLVKSPVANDDGDDTVIYVNLTMVNNDTTIGVISGLKTTVKDLADSAGTMDVVATIPSAGNGLVLNIKASADETFAPIVADGNIIKFAPNSNLYSGSSSSHEPIVTSEKPEYTCEVG